MQATALAGTDGADSPFFSPDGQQIAFFAGGKLKRISVAGGAPVTLCDAPNGRGGAWGEDGTIVFAPDGGPGAILWRVSSAGGKAEPLASLAEGEWSQQWPQVLPGGKAVLYTAPDRPGRRQRCEPRRAAAAERRAKGCVSRWLSRPVSADWSSGCTSTTGRSLPCRSISTSSR